MSKPAGRAARRSRAKFAKDEPAGRAARRSRAKLAGSAAALLVACAGGAPPERIVLVVVDTLRSDVLALHGGPVATPALEALAARGRRFDDALASFHQTSMSMASLFTGRTPSFESRDPRRPLVWNGGTWCGLARLAERRSEDACIPAALPTLAERLREAGYWTLGITGNALLHEPSGFSAGFDEWVELGAVDDRTWKRVTWREVNRAAFAGLDRRPRDRLFLYVHYMDVHDYALRQRDYADAVPEVDRALGGLLARLRGLGLLEGATVIVTSDHGEHLGESHPVPSGREHLGNPSYLELLRVPLVIAPPPPPQMAAALPSPIRTQDLYHGILALAEAPAGGTEELEPGELYVGELRYRTYLAGRWKSSLRRRDGAQLLFDLEGDPGETRDVAAEHPDVVRAHRQRLDEIARRLGTAHDPRAAGAALSARERGRLRALGYLDGR